MFVQENGGKNEKNKQQLKYVLLSSTHPDELENRPDSQDHTRSSETTLQKI